MFDKERKDMKLKIELGEDAKKQLKKLQPLLKALNKNVDAGEKAKKRLSDLDKLETEMQETVKLGEKSGKTLNEFYEWFDKLEKDLGSA